MEYNTVVWSIVAGLLILLVQSTTAHKQHATCAGQYLIYSTINIKGYHKGNDDVGLSCHHHDILTQNSYQAHSLYHE